MTTTYQVTREECEARISGVCPGCGGPVTAIETVDNADNPTHWSGCEHCCVFTEGYPAELHRLARQLVEEGTLVPYRTRGRDEPFWLEANTSEATRILWRIRRLEDASRPRSWHLPTIPADVTRVTANGALYERDKDRPSRWYQLNSVHARVGGWCELGQLFQVAGPDGIREAVPE
ncbi:MAG TPA: hypothetical protein VFY84_02990 [Jiangellales bacterium]|nr:hypothetical protein [Jiangellales bacterium]